MSRTVTLFTFALLMVSGAFAQKPAENAPAENAPAEKALSEKTIAIRAATLIDGASAQPRHNVLIVVRGNRIESVTDGGTPPANATVINFPAQVTVLPGLIDTHTHIFLQGEDPAARRI